MLSGTRAGGHFCAALHLADINLAYSITGIAEANTNTYQPQKTSNIEYHISNK